MSQKIVFITGVGRGIGQAIALTLAKQDYIVCGCARTLGQLEDTKKLSAGKVRITELDIADTEAVKTWIEKETLNSGGGKPWGLILCAGIQGPIGAFVENTFEEWRRCIEVNLLGSASVAQIFSQTLVAKKLSGSIVFLSGGGATSSRPNFSAYAAAKTAVVRLGETLAEELRPHNIAVNSIAPGAVNTSLTEEVLEAGPQKVGQKTYEGVLKQKATGGTSPQKAANLCAYLMSENGQKITGKLIAALWDSWTTLHESADSINSSELYTLRRVVKK
jgi:NAD(P)-dependent dehydrogenase (short-subunit alcohol dehydrogenase family)